MTMMDWANTKAGAQVQSLRQKKMCDVEKGDGWGQVRSAG